MPFWRKAHVGVLGPILPGPGGGPPSCATANSPLERPLAGELNGTEAAEAIGPTLGRTPALPQRATVHMGSNTWLPTQPTGLTSVAAPHAMVAGRNRKPRCAEHFAPTQSGSCRQASSWRHAPLFPASARSTGTARACTWCQ